MPAVDFTRVPGQCPILDRGVWHSGPLSLNEHFHPGWFHPVGRRATMPVTEATLSPFALQRRVDVVGCIG